MKLRTFLTISAVVALVYAVGLILAPGFMDTTYGFGGSSSEKLLTQFFGVELLALGVTTWLGRDLTGASARHLITGSLVGDAVGFIVALLGTLGGVMNSVGWSAVLIYLLLVLGYGYFQFMAPDK